MPRNKPKNLEWVHSTADLCPGSKVKAGKSGFSTAGLVPAYSVFKDEGGYNAEIQYVEFPNGHISVVARYGAKKGGFTYHEALEKYSDIVQYQAELEKRDVPLPPLERIVIEHDHKSEKAIVVKSSPWTGKDVLCLLQDRKGCTKKQIRKIVKDICRILVPVCRDRLVGWETKVGIDPRCSNFTVDKKGKMWFVDLFPPRYRKHGQPIIEWPEPKNELGLKLGYFKHYDVRGIMLTTMAQLARVRPELKEDFEEIVIRELGRDMSGAERAGFLKEFKATPWQKLRRLIAGPGRRKNLNAIKEIINKAPGKTLFGVDYNVYTLREIALELAHQGLMSQNELEDFFRASHFEDQLSAATVEKLQAMLTAFARRNP